MAFGYRVARVAKEQERELLHEGPWRLCLVLMSQLQATQRQEDKMEWVMQQVGSRVEVFVEDEKDPPSPHKIVLKLEKACIAKIAERIGMLELEKQKKQRLLKSAEEIDSALKNGI